MVDVVPREYSLGVPIFTKTRRRRRNRRARCEQSYRGRCSSVEIETRQFRGTTRVRGRGVYVGQVRSFDTKTVRRRTLQTVSGVTITIAAVVVSRVRRIYLGPLLPTENCPSAAESNVNVRLPVPSERNIPIAFRE